MDKSGFSYYRDRERELRMENERMRRILEPCVRAIVNVVASNWDGHQVLQTNGFVSAMDIQDGLDGYVECDPDIHDLHAMARKAISEAREALKEPDDA